MGNCLASCRPIKVPRGKVLQVVKTDGKTLEFSSPVLVKDVLVNFSGSGIGLSKEAAEHLPLDYELKLGQVYYILPSLRSVETISSAQTAGGVKRIKVVITKQQLKQLLTEQVSVEELVLSRLEKTSFSLDSPRNWKPKLESIPEGCE
ncbi:hypothetical protein P3X46_017372 [Hevea brasiliensis]|uniref:PilZ domain-containing protein n=1 Tax=Hevea brasiliensis TaxID=3981 RepID=A0ABQ9M604_HEVBR|nr:uncharacterized protein LOC110664396 [Hevea brasiliensis]KAJ9174339.1 hypothetical protein P3X46_017372 [Hevea brasiliensis]